MPHLTHGGVECLEGLAGRVEIGVLTLDRYGISKALGQDAYFDTPGQALEAFHSAMR